MDFQGLFLKGAKGAWGWGCLEVKLATNTFFPFVNSIFILHPHHLGIYIGNGGGGGFRSSPEWVRVEEGMYLKKIKFNNKFL